MQRQILPEMARDHLGAVGSGLRSSSALAAMIMPDVQKPHWAAKPSMKACCSGCKRAVGVRPSSVSTACAVDALDRQQAGELRLAVDEHRAGAAGALVAAAPGAGQAELVAQHVEQRRPGRDEIPRSGR